MTRLEGAWVFEVLERLTSVLRWWHPPRTFTAASVVRSARGAEGPLFRSHCTGGWGARPHLWALTSCVLSLPHSSLLLPCLVEALQQILVQSRRLPFTLFLF